MYLQKLEIQGFKSFAQKITFTFPAGDIESKGITSIVGPNGSGKSNVADAIRWVLGEQSMKLLRSKRSEDVIFYGSDKKAQLGFCEVALFFNNEDHAFPVDYAEVVIMRRLYRTGESEYYLNANKIRHTDVQLLCAQAAIGQRSYSVIGQGMIDSIINTAPADRKDFFDEAVGVKQYQMKKDSAISKLKSTKANVLQAQNIITELEPKLKFFQRQIKRLEEREEVQTSLQKLLTHYYNTIWNDARAKGSELAGRLATAKKTVDTHTSEYGVIQKEFGIRERESYARDAGGFAELQKEYGACAQEKNRLSSTIALLDGRLQLEFEKTGEVQLASLQSKKMNVLERRGHVQLELASIVESLGGKRSELERRTRECAALQEKLAVVEERAGALSAPQAAFTHESIVSELREIGQELPRHEESYSWLRTWVDGLFARVHTLIRRIESSTGNQSQKELDDVRGEIRALRLQKDEASALLQQLRAEVRFGEERQASLTQQMKEVEAGVVRIETDIASISSQSNEDAREKIQMEQRTASKRLLEVEKKLSELNVQLSSYHAAEKEAHTLLVELQKKMAAKQREIDSARAHLSSIELENARAEAHHEDLLKKIIEEFHCTVEHEALLMSKTETLHSLLGFQDTVEPCDRNETRETIERLKRKLDQIGTIDEEIVSEYESTKERYEFLTKQAEDLIGAIASLKEAITDLDALIKERFDASLAGINKKFNEYFQKLFSGGSARLIVQKREIAPEDERAEKDEFDDGDDVAGIDIEATPPGKKLRSIAVLSGGEKALTAVALICAILANNPSPFVVLDEVDAALDESNANRLAEILQELSVRTQFIIITHNRVTMHIAHLLYGVTMGDDGISRVLSLDIRTVSASIGQ